MSAGGTVQVVSTPDRYISGNELLFIAADGQVLTLTVRDRGCSCCGSDYERDWELQAP